MIYVTIKILSLLITTACVVTSVFAEDSASVTFEVFDDSLDIQVDGRPIATYVFKDPKIPRPYFAHVKVPQGIQVTRNHPPRADEDRADHATMHPGIWMAFGDLNGADFWRNRAKIKHAGFLESPQGGTGSGSFVEQKLYLPEDGPPICQEVFRCKLRVIESGYLLQWVSTFSSQQEFFFGDQEEMGLGIRVATPISELAGGELTDSEGRRGAQAIWSNAARWCDYSGEIDGQHVGLTIFVHPENFRPSWMHARNYGFVAANPFGRQAMRKGLASKVVVRPGESLTLRYAIWIHSEPKNETGDIQKVFAEYLDGS